MSVTKTATNIDTFKINYLTQEMYNEALSNDEINENELYFISDNSSIAALDALTVGNLIVTGSTCFVGAVNGTDYHRIFVSTSTPSGGANGDIWYVYAE